MIVKASIQYIVKKENDNFLIPYIIKLQAKDKVKEFKNVVNGQDQKLLLKEISEHFYSLFLKPTKLIIGITNKGFEDILIQNTPEYFNIQKIVCKEIDEKNINILETVLEEKKEIKPAISLPSYLFFSYEDIVGDLKGEAKYKQLLLYLQMVNNYFQQYPEKVIDELPIFTSMKKKILLEKDIKTIEEFLLFINEKLK